MTTGHCLSCLQHKTQLKIPLQLPKGHKTVSVLICSLKNVCGQFTKPGHFFKSPRCKIGAPRRIFTYSPENIWGTIGCVTEGVFVKQRNLNVWPSQSFENRKLNFLFWLLGGIHSNVSMVGFIVSTMGKH